MSGKRIHEHDALLNAYIDRELDRTQEEELYAELAQSDELRSRLKEMQTVRSESRNYLAGLAPSAALTDKVFTGLGFRIPEGAAPPSNGTTPPPAAAGSGAGTGTTAGNLFLAAQKLWLPITAAVITATVTTVILFNVLQDSGSSNAGPNATAGPQIETNEQPPTPDAGSSVPPAERVEQAETESAGSTAGTSQQSTAIPPAVEDEPSASNTTTASIGTRSTAKEATTSTVRPGTPDADESSQITRGEETAVPSRTPAVKPIKQNSSSPAAPERNTTPENTVGTSPTLVEKPAETRKPFVRETVSLPENTDPLSGVMLHGPPDQEEPPQIIERPREEFAMPWNAFTGFSLHWRLIPQGVSSPNVSTAETHGTPSFNNMTLALYYSPSAHHAWGVEFAQEPWNQQYSGQIRDKRLVMQRTVTQNYRTWSLIARYRYTTDPILGSQRLTLFGDIGAGFTRDWWAVTRGTLGMQYNLFGNLNLTAGADAGGLFYTFDGTQFSTWKLGGTFGLSLGF
ncbi:MAG: hypothetical protein CL946_02170 [Ectothiorhodospiraceae bacterium]|nr:hypothetical protein [Ectothiorhodospiraceae bacterium]